MFLTLASTISLHHQTTKRARRQDEATRQIRLSKKRNSEKSTECHRFQIGILLNKNSIMNSSIIHFPKEVKKSFKAFEMTN